MKKILSLFLIFSMTIGYLCADTSKTKDIILIISSYNPDTQRMAQFISEFEETIINSEGDRYQILIEDMACKSVNTSDNWSEALTIMLNRYADNSVKAIILLGQEAFSTYLSLEKYPIDTPFFACFASENGVNLNSDTIKSINMIEQSYIKGRSGGSLNRYDVDKNLKLILDIYPDTKNIAFLSDNTYGGISLQALVKQKIETNYPQLNLINIDSRFIDQTDIPLKVKNLPPYTVLLLGTWRVDKNGMYMMNNAISDTKSLNKTIPTFTLTGTGMGTVAIGGYIPKYAGNGKDIAKQVLSYYKEGQNATFNVGECEYRFDIDLLNEFEIRESHLPKNSILFKTSDHIIQKYRVYIFGSLSLILILIISITWLYNLYSHKKALQKELIIAKESAEQSDRVKTAFLANMGHEIRTPLNSIVGFSNLICESNIEIQEREEYCKIIGKNSEMLLTLMNDILDIARMESGKMTFNFNQEEVVSICQQVIYTTKHLQKENVECVFVPGEHNAIIYTDNQRTSQILINLISNALKFTDNGSVTLSYTITKDDKYVIFSVTDTGCGIPEELQHIVFERFEKLNNHKQGTGLGLSICKQLSHRLGGDVWLDTTYTSGGARFLFSHPLTQQNN